MKMTIDLNQAGSIDKALEELEKFQEKLLQFATDLVNELADEGADIAGLHFERAIYAGMKDHQPKRTELRFTKWKRRAKVVVEGDTVLFIEFGTGITKAEAPDEEAEVVKGRVMSHGAYGNRNAENPDGWYYTGHKTLNDPPDTEHAFYPGTRIPKPNSMKTFGNDANSSMWNARKELEQKYSEIVQRVYERSFGR